MFTPVAIVVSLLSNAFTKIHQQSERRLPGRMKLTNSSSSSFFKITIIFIRNGKCTGLKTVITFHTGTTGVQTALSPQRTSCQALVAA